MLAATWFGVAPADAYTAPLSAGIGQQNPASVQSIQAAPPIEGGFITILQPGLSFDREFVLTNSVDFSAAYQLYIGNLATDATGQSAVVTSGLIDLSSGIRPSVITSSDGIPRLGSRIESVGRASPTYQGPGNEGGPIPIESILPGIRHQRGSESPEQKYATLAPGPSTESPTRSQFNAPAPAQTAAKTVPAVMPTLAMSLSAKTAEQMRDERVSPTVVSYPSQTLSGEWARAMIFETAGGEPEDFRPPVSGQRRQSSADDGEQPRPIDGRSFSTDDAQGDRLRSLAHGATAVQSLRGISRLAPPEQAANRASTAAGLTTAGLERPDTFASTQKWTGGRSFIALLMALTLADEENADPLRRDLDLDDTAHSVHVASVEGLGASGTAILKSSDEDAAQSRVLEASPLLVVLALEWIAVRNWPRPVCQSDLTGAADGSLVASARPPRRSKSNAGR